VKKGCAMENFKKLFYDLKAKAEQKRDTSEIIAKLSYDLYIKTRPDIKDKKCLDIGIGSGWSMHSLLASGCSQCDGIDISKERLKQTDNLLKSHDFNNYNLKLGDAENLEHCHSDYYDYVNYLDILEHLPDYNKGIREVYRVLKKGGLVYVKTPNNYTDSELQLHHYGQTLFSLLFPQHVPPPGSDNLMLRDDLKRLSEEEQEQVHKEAPEGFHEHIHQFYPDELYTFLTQSGFEVISLSGTPLFTDILYNNEALLKTFAEMYTEFFNMKGYHALIKSLKKDLLAAGTKPSFIDLPSEYIFSDNLIVVARKK
jgi:ubiquinone/menaquinone biosynthesis C-methylase UbiE